MFRLKDIKINGDTLSWRVKSLENKTLLNYLYEDLSFSTNLIKQAKSHEGLILVNNKERTVRHIIKNGDNIVIKLPKVDKGMYMQPTDIPLSVLYEDEHLLIVNKQANQATVPSALHKKNTLANSLLFHYEKNNLPYTVHVVTRLDRDTSGIVIIAKHRYCHSLLGNEKSKINRKYFALITGKLTKKQSQINLPIGRSRYSIIERCVTSSGKSAVTNYKVMKEYTDYSLVEVTLETGRTHQIRVHFSHIDHPLLGDDLYGGDQSLINRQALHCSQVSFIHPFTDEPLLCEAELPKDMSDLLRK